MIAVLLCFWNALAQFDEAVFAAVHGAASNPLLDGVMITLSIVGRGYFWLVATLPFLYRRHYRKFWAFIIALGLTNLFVLALKLGVARPRPPVLAPLLTDYTFPSFPSGHAASAFCSSVFLIFAWRRWYLTVTLGVYASLIALSRVYIGVHYPSDIIAGALLGAVIGYYAYQCVTRKTKLGRLIAKWPAPLLRRAFQECDDGNGGENEGLKQE